MFLADLIKQSARGDLVQRGENVNPWKRAVVLAVDVLGGRLENETGSGSVEHVIDNTPMSIDATIGPTNPRNSIKARVLSLEGDKFRADDDLVVFWPMFPEHISIPIKPGEHVYVTFEDEDQTHGLWFSKVPGHSNSNYFKGDSSYTQDAPLSSKFADDAPADTDSDSDSVASGRQPQSNIQKFKDSD